MGKIIDFLMARDGLSYEEAEREARSGLAHIESAIMDGDYMCAEDALDDVFGMEPESLSAW